MNVQAKTLSEITRHAIDLLSKEMGIVDICAVSKPVHDWVRRLYRGAGTLVQRSDT